MNKKNWLVIGAVVLIAFGVWFYFDESDDLKGSPQDILGDEQRRICIDGCLCDEAEGWTVIDRTVNPQTVTCYCSDKSNENHLEFSPLFSNCLENGEIEDLPPNEGDDDNTWAILDRLDRCQTKCSKKLAVIN